MKHYTYDTVGTCSKHISFDIDETNQTIHNVSFVGGCNGNLQGICNLIEGMEMDKLREKFGGIRCGNKETSCPDQLACAIKLAQQ